MSMRVLMIAPPGAGKGTQGALIAGRESARPAGHAIKDRGKQVNHHASAGSTRH
jgi:adenylate kinase family enzyme